MSITYNDAPRKGANKVVASFIYDDGDEHPIARIDRIEPGDGTKSFLPYAASGSGFASSAGLNGMKLPLYRRTDVLRVAVNGTIVLVEGEGKGDALRAKLGQSGDIAVTTIAFGARQELTDDHVADFAGARRIIVLCDSDKPGRECGTIRAQRLKAMHTEAEVRVVDLFPELDDGSDIADWLTDGHALDELWPIVDAAARMLKPESKSSGLEVVSLHNVVSETTEWLWRSRIPRGKISMLVGDPGCGKSYISLAIASAITHGRALPDGESIAPGDVLIWNGEDGVADTIRPRAEAVGAALDRIHVIEGEMKNGEHRAFGLASIDLLTQHVANNPNIVMVVIEPIAALLAGVDSHKDADVRASLQPLAEFAKRTGVAVLCIAHLNKKQAEAALYRVGGSIGFVGLARSVLLAAVDPEDGRRAIVPLKCNLAAKPKAIEYRIDDEGRFWWGQTSDLTAEKLLAAPTNRGGAVKKAQEFLKDVLAGGPRPSTEVDVLRQEQMLSESSVDRARKKLGVETFRRDGKDSVWMMALPGEERQPSLGE